MRDASLTTARDHTRTYVFPVDVVAEIDDRWSATCPTLPGCATWARTRGGVLKNISEAIEAYVEDLVASGEEIPPQVHVLDQLAVTVTV